MPSLGLNPKAFVEKALEDDAVHFGLLFAQLFQMGVTALDVLISVSIGGGHTMTKTADEHVGRAIQRRREKLAMKPSELAARIGVTELNIIEFENGLQRVSASRLYMIAKTLEAHLANFFEGVSA